MGKRKKIDWEAIGKEYALGQKSVRNIADEFGVSHTAINKRAKKYNWVQDKSQEIRKKTLAGLVGFHADVSKKVSTPTQEDVERVVKTNIEVVRGHRKDISKGRELVDLFYGQLDEAARNREVLQETIYDETKGGGDEKDDLRRRNFMMKSVSLPSHASVLRDLSTTLKNLIPLERQAFNLNEGTEDNEVVFKVKYENRVLQVEDGS